MEKIFTCLQNTHQNHHHHLRIHNVRHHDIHHNQVPNHQEYLAKRSKSVAKGAQTLAHFHAARGRWCDSASVHRHTTGIPLLLRYGATELEAYDCEIRDTYSHLDYHLDPVSVREEFARE